MHICMLAAAVCHAYDVAKTLPIRLGSAQTRQGAARPLHLRKGHRPLTLYFRT